MPLYAAGGLGASPFCGAFMVRYSEIPFASDTKSDGMSMIVVEFCSAPT
jgi:hypothetical protein